VISEIRLINLHLAVAGSSANRRPPPRRADGPRQVAAFELVAAVAQRAWQFFLRHPVQRIDRVFRGAGRVFTLDKVPVSVIFELDRPSGTRAGVGDLGDLIVGVVGDRLDMPPRRL
jgi:hypothetical protein